MRNPDCPYYESCKMALRCPTVEERCDYKKGYDEVERLIQIGKDLEFRRQQEKLHQIRSLEGQFELSDDNELRRMQDNV